MAATAINQHPPTNHSDAPAVITAICVTRWTWTKAEGIKIHLSQSISSAVELAFFFPNMANPF